MAITQMQCLLTLWLKMSHFIRSVLNHGKCGTRLKLLPLVSLFICGVGIFSSCHDNNSYENPHFL